jgi:DNA invertase Pin-like site-specific DNA recombinase
MNGKGRAAMKIGYARTSTVEQAAGLADQERELKAAGIERLFSEQVSAVAQSRPQFDLMMATLRHRDVVIVTKLDRLARSMADLMKIIEATKAAGASLRVLAIGLDTSNATGKLILNVMGSIAEFERELMLERQRAGIAKAKAEGKYKGRKRVFSDERLVALKAAGLGAQAIADELGVSRVAVYKRLRAVEEAS